MPLTGAKPKEDRSQVRHRNPVADWTEVVDAPFEDGPEMPERKGPEMSAALMADAGVIPGAGWPWQTVRWWSVIRRMPHAKLWSAADWEFAMATLEIHARTFEGWRGYTGGELRQREKLLGVYMDARRELRIRYVPVPDAQGSGHDADVLRLADYRDL
jgi:hypothetical protein